MALRDKLNNLATAATSKANSAIENGKLSLKIANEEKKINEFTLSIGELLLDKLDAGEVFDDEIAALYDSIKASREIIDAAKAEIEANRPAVPVCAGCGEELPADVKFCPNCGTKVPEIEIPEPPACPACGAPVDEDQNFCTECGTKVAADEPAVEAPAE